jgi:hypothetical protein
VIKFVSDLRQVGGSLASSISKNDRHDITEILLKVTLNTITLTMTLYEFDIYVVITFFCFNFVCSLLSFCFAHSYRCSVFVYLSYRCSVFVYLSYRCSVFVYLSYRCSVFVYLSYRCSVFVYLSIVL